MDGVPAPAGGPNGWVYDPASNMIFFNGSPVPAEGANVEVSYLGETVCLN